MSNLIDDIRRAREALGRRKEEASEAGLTLKMCQAEQRKAQTALDELLDELVSGQSRYPMFERIERTERNGTHDEHQRGPTDFPDGIPVSESSSSRKRKKPAAQ